MSARKRYYTVTFTTNSTLHEIGQTVDSLPGTVQNLVIEEIVNKPAEEASNVTE